MTIIGICGNSLYRPSHCVRDTFLCLIQYWATCAAEASVWCKSVQRSIVRTFSQLNGEFIKENELAGQEKSNWANLTAAVYIGSMLYGA